MANQAEVYVTNQLQGNIKVIRNLKEGDKNLNDLDIPVTFGVKERIPLPGPEAFLIIHPPLEMKLEDCWLKVKSKVDLTILCSLSNSNWTIKLKSNALGSDLPTTVNVTVGTNGP